MSNKAIQTMKARNAISGALATCFITIAGRRYNAIQMKNLEATIEKTKAEVPVLGKTGVGNKPSGWKGKGKATMYYNSAIFRQALKTYKETGLDMYFEIQVTNEDPTSEVGAQTVILKEVNLDGLVLTKFDVDAEYLEEDVEFTFDDFEIVERFKVMKGAF